MASTEALFDHRAGCVQEVPDAATRCRSVHTVANGSGGLIQTNSTTIVPFSSADRRRKNAAIEVPDHCGNGHRLTPDNVRVEQREHRWRCRQCGSDRAAVFRERQRTG